MVWRAQTGRKRGYDRADYYCRHIFIFYVHPSHTTGSSTTQVASELELVPYSALSCETILIIIDPRGGIKWGKKHFFFFLTLSLILQFGNKMDTVKTRHSHTQCTLYRLFVFLSDFTPFSPSSLRRRRRQGDGRANFSILRILLLECLHVSLQIRIDAGCCGSRVKFSQRLRAQGLTLTTPPPLGHLASVCFITRRHASSIENTSRAIHHPSI